MKSTSDNLTEQVSEKAVLQIPEGMLGFSRLTKYMLIEEERLRPFRWLQSLDDSELAFPVIDVNLIDGNYFRHLPAKELASLKVTHRSELLVLIVGILRGGAGETSVNLKAPLLINHATMTGRQIILTELRANLRTPAASLFA